MPNISGNCYQNLGKYHEEHLHCKYHLRGKYHWGSDLGLFPLDLNQGTGQVTLKWPQPFYREDARRTLDKHGGIHKPER